MSQIRTELITPAVNFLKDPKVQTSPLQKRVAFLESKGLTSEEIEEALKQAKAGQSTDLTQTTNPQQQTNPLPLIQQQQQQPLPPPIRRIDWRDYFIAAVLIGGISYAIKAIFKKYILPLFKTPTATELERDKRSLSDQFTTTMEKLEVVKADARLVKNTIDEQVVKVKGTLDNLDDVLKNLHEKDDKRDAEIKKLKEYVNEIKDSVPKLFMQSKESQNQSLIEINQELKSLKSLILNRRNPQNIGSPIVELSSSSPSSSLPSSPIITTTIANPNSSSPISPTFQRITSERPSIPPWQLASKNSPNDNNTSAMEEEE